MNEPKTAVLEKISSGIEGFDDITFGGLPLRRTTLLMGGPGCGKDLVLALQMLVNGSHGPPRHARNLWRLRGKWAARVGQWRDVRLEHAGTGEEASFRGCLHTSRRCPVRRVRHYRVTRGAGGKGARDGCEDDRFRRDRRPPESARRSRGGVSRALPASRLAHAPRSDRHPHDEDPLADQPSTAQRYGFMPFMADCAVLLSQQVADRVAVRTIRVLKCGALRASTKCHLSSDRPSWRWALRTVCIRSRSPSTSGFRRASNAWTRWSAAASIAPRMS